MELLRLLSTNEIVAQVICFLALLAILRATFWKKALRALDARRARIAGEIALIEKQKASVETLRADYARHLERIDDEAREHASRAIAAARLQGDEIRRRAEKDAQRILENARESIKAELALAKEELKDRIVDLTIDVTEKIIQEKYSEADDKRLIGDFLKGIERR